MRRSTSSIPHSAAGYLWPAACSGGHLFPSPLPSGDLRLGPKRELTYKLAIPVSTISIMTASSTIAKSSIGIPLIAPFPFIVDCDQSSAQ